MAQIKAHEFERLLATQALPYRIALVYGPDRGLVAERAAALAARSGIDPDDAFAAIRIDAAELAGDPGRLHDEANALGLFGGERLIWIKNAGNDRGLAGALAALGDDPPPSARIIVEAGELKKGAALRKAAEDARGVVAVPCYADEGRAIQALIDEELSAAGLPITPDARRRLTELLGGDRMASRNELRKLTLYAMGGERITEEDVALMVGDAGALSVDAAVDALLRGDPPALDQALQRIVASKMAVYTVLAAAIRQFQALLALRTRMEEEDMTASRIMQGPGRSVHFRRKPLVEQLLARWRSRQLAAVLDHLHVTVLETRRAPALEAALARQSLLAVALRIARAGRSPRR